MLFVHEERHFQSPRIQHPINSFCCIACRNKWNQLQLSLRNFESYRVSKWVEIQLEGFFKIFIHLCFHEIFLHYRNMNFSKKRQVCILKMPMYKNGDTSPNYISTHCVALYCMYRLKSLRTSILFNILSKFLTVFSTQQSCRISVDII